MSKAASNEALIAASWRSTMDSKTGRVYYYNAITKATTWNKPIELASPEERAAMIAKKEHARKFFLEMERNIFDKIERGREKDVIKKSRTQSSGSAASSDYLDDGYYLGAPSSNHLSSEFIPINYNLSSSATADMSTLRRLSSMSDENGAYYYCSNSSTSLMADQKMKLDVELNAASSSKDILIPSSNNNNNNNNNNNRAAKSCRFDIDLPAGEPASPGKASSRTPQRSDPSKPSATAAVASLSSLRLSTSRSISGSSGSSSSSSGSGRVAIPRRVRTISSVDDAILLTMSRYQKKQSAMVQAASVVAYSPIVVDFSSMSMSSLQLQDDALTRRISGKYPLVPPVMEPKALIDNMDMNANTKPQSLDLKRRNSTSTIFLASTMTTQDNDATIECVCVVIRTYMIDAAEENVIPLAEFDVFKDASFIHPSPRKEKEQQYKEEVIVDTIAHNLSMVPSLSAVKEFFGYVFSKSQLESDCIIMTLIYVERLVKETRGRLCLRFDNWRSIVFACIVMASKVWDDLSMWNVDFSQVYPSFNLERVNQLELSILEALNYVIRVTASEYAKYYFHLRSMMTRLGIDCVHDYDVENAMMMRMRPLDIDGARRLQLSTERYRKEAIRSKLLRRRFHSLSDGLSDLFDIQCNSSEEPVPADQQHHVHTPVHLEQLVHSNHTDADGQTHKHNQLRKNSFRLDKSGSSHSISPKPSRSADKSDAKEVTRPHK